MKLDERLTPYNDKVAASWLKGTVAAEKFVDGKIYVVTQPVLALTNAPDPHAALASQLLMGERFTVYDIDDKTQLAYGQNERDGYVGYVPFACLSKDLPEPTHFVSMLSTHIYDEPKMKSRPFAALPFMAMVTVENEGEEFAQLSSMEGYIPKRHLVDIESFYDDFVAVAEQFIGLPYLWGGRSSFGIDCSGLIQQSLTAAGLEYVMRDTDLQEQYVGEPLGSKDKLKRGDLVFWRGHIGVMRDADRIIHANAHHMAVVSEPLQEAAKRIEKASGGPVTARKRVSIPL